MAGRYWWKAIPQRCVACRRREARYELWVDPGPEQPVTFIDVFCGQCKVAETRIRDGDADRPQPIAGEAHDEL